MNIHALIGYQDDGFVKTLSEANAAIHAAKNLTPKSERNQYRSSIRWSRDGYYWTWVLK